MGRKKSFFYTERQNALIEKAANSNNSVKMAKTLARQFNRPYAGIMLKIYKIKNANKSTSVVSKPVAKTEYIERKEKFVTLAKDTTLNFTNVKRAEMHADHVRIYF